MTELKLSLTLQEERWLDDWSVLSGYQTPQQGVMELLKVAGAIPRGSEYFKKRFAHLE